MALKILKILLLAVIVFGLPGMYIFSLRGYIIRLVSLLLLCTEFVSLFRLVFYKPSNTAWFKSFFLALTSVSVFLIFLETVCMFVPIYHGINHSYGSKIWFKMYWNPINSFGFRDREPRQNETTILFVGDSFTAGHGIKNIRDRFSDIVGKQLSYVRSANIGKNGLDSGSEYDLMIDFISKTKIKPSKIILQYFGNDIDRIAIRNGLKFKGFIPYTEISNISRYLINSSFLLNFIYWSFPSDYSKEYIDFIVKAFENEYIFKEHLKDLQRFIDYAKESAAELVVVVFPFMQSFETSWETYSEKIISFFKMNGVKTVDVALLTADLKAIERVVNKNDGHASTVVHKRVADEIIRIIDK